VSLDWKSGAVAEGLEGCRSSDSSWPRSIALIAIWRNVSELSGAFASSGRTIKSRLFPREKAEMRAQHSCVGRVLRSVRPVRPAGLPR
jgi:hypothetical protein